MNMNVHENHAKDVFQAAEEWKNLLRKTQPARKNGSHDYIVISNHNKTEQQATSLPLSQFTKTTEKISVKKIVETSKEVLANLGAELIDAQKNNKLTNKEVRKFTDLRSDILSYTESVIQTRQQKGSINQLMKVVVFVLSFLSGGAIKLWERHQKFEEEIYGLKTTVQSLREDPLNLIKQKFDSNLELLTIDLKYPEEFAKELLAIEDENIEQLIDRINEQKSEITNLERELSNLADFSSLWEKVNMIRDFRAFFTKEINMKKKEKESLKSQKEIATTTSIRDRLEKQASDKQQMINSLEGKLTKLPLLDESINYLNDILKNRTDNLSLTLKAAAKFTYLKTSFFKEIMPTLDRKSYEQTIQSFIQGTFNDQLAQYSKLDPSERATLMNQFEIDLPRGISFIRIDDFLKIHDENPIPLPNSPKKLSDGSKAIADLIENPTINSDWISILQLAATQTSLNGAFHSILTALTLLGNDLKWIDEGNDYAFIPEFPEKDLPPITLKIIRDESNQSIKEVQVSVEGSLNLVEKQVSSQSTQAGQRIAEQAKNKIIVEGAIKVKLDYTIRLDDNKHPVIGNMRCSTTTNIPAISDK